MTRAALADLDRIRRHGYRVARWDGYGWVLYDSTDAQLMVGDHGGIAPTQAAAVAEAIRRIEEDERHAAEAADPDSLPRLDLDALNWTDADPDDPEPSRLVASFWFGPHLFHLEAIPVTTVDGVQEAVAWGESTLEALRDAAQADGPFDTVRLHVDGAPRDYVVYAHPGS